MDEIVENTTMQFRQVSESQKKMAQMQEATPLELYQQLGMDRQK